MNPVTNPFAPGAGTPPPELAGRDELRETVRVAIERVRLGLPTKSILMVGLRGVGKTVLLDRRRDDAEATGIHTARVEAPESRSLPAILAPQLRQALLRLSRNDRAKDLAHRALRGLAGFAKALKVKYADIEVGLDFEPEAGLADNGDLEHDLQALRIPSSEIPMMSRTITGSATNTAKSIRRLRRAGLTAVSSFRFQVSNSPRRHGGHGGGLTAVSGFEFQVSSQTTPLLTRGLLPGAWRQFRVSSFRFQVRSNTARRSASREKRGD